MAWQAVQGPPNAKHAALPDRSWVVAFRPACSQQSALPPTPRCTCARTCMTMPRLVVPTTNSLRPGGGAFFSSTSSVCSTAAWDSMGGRGTGTRVHQAGSMHRRRRCCLHPARRTCSTALEKRGPMATYSSRRSMSSSTITLRGDCAAGRGWRLFQGRWEPRHAGLKAEDAGASRTALRPNVFGQPARRAACSVDITAPCMRRRTPLQSGCTWRARCSRPLFPR